MKYQNLRIPFWKTAMHRQLRYAVLATALFASTAFAGARQELDTFTRGLKGLDGQFSQRVTDANGRVKETSSGRVALATPRQFRWEYAKPYKQLIVADGRRSGYSTRIWSRSPCAHRAAKNRTARWLR